MVDYDLPTTLLLDIRKELQARYRAAEECHEESPFFQKLLVYLQFLNSSPRLEKEIEYIEKEEKRYMKLWKDCYFQLQKALMEAEKKLLNLLQGQRNTSPENKEALDRYRLYQNGHEDPGPLPVLKQYKLLMSLAEAITFTEDQFDIAQLENAFEGWNALLTEIKSSLIHKPVGAWFFLRLLLWGIHGEEAKHKILLDMKYPLVFQHQAAYSLFAHFSREITDILNEKPQHLRDFGKMKFIQRKDYLAYLRCLHTHMLGQLELSKGEAKGRIQILYKNLLFDFGEGKILCDQKQIASFKSKTAQSKAMRILLENQGITYDFEELAEFLEMTSVFKRDPIGTEKKIRNLFDALNKKCQQKVFCANKGYFVAKT